MRYVSTRGDAPELGFRDVLLQGLARDGGLYVPREWPRFSEDEIAEMAGLSFPEVAKRVIAPFVGDEIDPATLSDMVDEAYATFNHRAVAPLVQLEANHYVLELFHGPTMAFKDVAMQLLARLMDHVLAERGARATIIGATSGDTGSAAIEAFRGRKSTRMVILYPQGRISDVQRRQMTTVNDKAVSALAVKGNFDHCQAMVKDMFNDHAFRDSVQLAGVNSINWARIMAQIAYYFFAASALGAPHRAVSFTVPTGNFGDIFAGYVAKRMGLPIDDLVIATNENDILARYLTSGEYRAAGVTATTSPSMDIEVSSNFERLLFEATKRNSNAVSRWMATLKENGGFATDYRTFQRIQDEFKAGRCDERETKDEISKTFSETGYLLDPHTAVGTHVARGFMKPGVAMVTLGTAHPAKFPAAVKAATGTAPALPASQGDLMKRKEVIITAPADANAIKRFITTGSLSEPKPKVAAAKSSAKRRTRATRT